jgi:glyoxylase-like metal-dependent hydrolase (beta-lactamase superfamily II)
VIRVIRILAPNPGVYTLDGTNTWVVGEDPSVVIDPGPADEGHLAEVERTAGRVAAVLVTHDHADHAEAAGAFGARVRAAVHAVRLPGAEPLADGQTFPADGARITAIATPGHSADHVAFLETSTGALFTGDAVLGRGTSFIDPPDGDLASYLASLERMLALDARTIHPGHGPIRTDAREVLRGYLDHRAEREAEILEALGRGPAAVSDIVASVYAAYPPDIHPLAERSVTAHLVKLEQEDRVERRGHGDAQTWAIAVAKTCARCGDRMKGPGAYCRRCMVTMLQGTSG